MAITRSNQNQKKPAECKPAPKNENNCHQHRHHHPEHRKHLQGRNPNKQRRSKKRCTPKAPPLELSTIQTFEKLSLMSTSRADMKNLPHSNVNGVHTEGNNYIQIDDSPISQASSTSNKTPSPITPVEEANANSPTPPPVARMASTARKVRQHQCAFEFSPSDIQKSFHGGLGRSITFYQQTAEPTQHHKLHRSARIEDFRTRIARK